MREDTPAEVLFEKIGDVFDNVFSWCPEDGIVPWLVVFPIGVTFVAYMIIFDRCRHLFTGMDLEDAMP